MRQIIPFREPLDVTVTTKRRGKRTFRQAVVICEPGAGTPSPRIARTAPPTDRWEVIMPMHFSRSTTVTVDANTKSEARAMVKDRINAQFGSGEGKNSRLAWGRLPIGTKVRRVERLRERARDRRR